VSIIKECIGLIGGHSGDSLTDELHKRGYIVALVAGKDNEPGMDSAEYVLTEDLSNHKLIIKYFVECNVKNVVIGTGHSKAIELAKVLETEGFKTNIDYNKSILAKDKVKFKNLLIKIGIKTPEFISFRDAYSIDEIINRIGLPCVVKSATDAVQPQKVNAKEDLQYAICNIKNTDTEVLIERYINGNDCTVAIINDGKYCESLGVTYYSKAKEYKLKGFDNAHSTQLSERKEQEICAIAKKIVDTLGFIGLLRIDFIIDEDVFVLELNSVIVTGYNGSAYPFFKIQGIDIAKKMIDTAIRIFENKDDL